MTQDFTKIGIQPKPPDDALTDMIRNGVPPVSGKAGLTRMLDKLSGDVPLGADAPTRPLRKFIAGSWALQHMVKYGLGAALLLLAGLAFCWVSVKGEFSLRNLALGVACLAAAFVLGRAARGEARALRSISKA